MSSTGNAEESLQPSPFRKSLLCPLWPTSMLHRRDRRYSRFLSRLWRVRNDSPLHFYFYIFIFGCEYFLKVGAELGLLFVRCICVGAMRGILSLIFLMAFF